MVIYLCVALVFASAFFFSEDLLEKRYFGVGKHESLVNEEHKIIHVDIEEPLRTKTWVNFDMPGDVYMDVISSGYRYKNTYTKEELKEKWGNSWKYMYPEVSYGTFLGMNFINREVQLKNNYAVNFENFPSYSWNISFRTTHSSTNTFDYNFIMLIY